jgi:hypothetical protein
MYKIVALDDLSSRQVEIFAKAKGVRDTKALLSAAERADAWSFTSRPEDLKDLVAFWNEHGCIGTRLDLMENGIRRRLEEAGGRTAGHSGPRTIRRAHGGVHVVPGADGAGPRWIGERAGPTESADLAIGSGFNSPWCPYAE